MGRERSQAVSTDKTAAPPYVNGTGTTFWRGIQGTEHLRILFHATKQGYRIVVEERRVPRRATCPSRYLSCLSASATFADRPWPRASFRIWPSNHNIATRLARLILAGQVGHSVNPGRQSQEPPSVIVFRFHPLFIFSDTHQAAYHAGDEPDSRTMSTLKDNGITDYDHEARRVRHSKRNTHTNWTKRCKG